MKVGLKLFLYQETNLNPKKLVTLNYYFIKRERQISNRNDAFPIEVMSKLLDFYIIQLREKDELYVHIRKIMSPFC